VIVLDTNVLSALMQREPPAEVVGWLDEQPADSIWITAITVFEIRFGVLGFDQSAAIEAGRMAARQRRGGRPVEIRDVEIAGIVAARRCALATRSQRHFEGLGLSLIDPWDPVS